MSKFMDVNTFEIVDNVFEVDDDIAETISILNKKKDWQRPIFALAIFGV